MKSKEEKEWTMKRMKKYALLSLLALFVLSTPAWVLAQDTMILVASQASLVKAQPWIDFLKKNEITVEHVVPSEFKSVKNKKYITIMGGMDEPGIKDIVTEVVSAGEASDLAKAGAKKMFMKENTWVAGQRVLVFAGDNAESAAAARTESREAWMKYLKDWFDLGEGPGGLKAY
jgi:hypothetical protein